MIKIILVIAIVISIYMPSYLYAGEEIVVEEYVPDSDSECANWHYKYKQLKDMGNEEEADPKSFSCALNDLLSNNIKYVGKFNYTNSAIDTTKVRVDENGQIVVNDRGEPQFDTNLTDETANLYSIGINYNITIKDLIGAFDQEIKLSPNYFIFYDRISLAALKFSSTYEFSNAGTANNLDDFSIDVKTDKGFKFNLGVNYTGCLGDLLKFKLGCYDYDGYFNDAKASYDREVKNPKLAERQAVEKAKAEAEINSLRRRISVLENKILSEE